MHSEKGDDDDDDELVGVRCVDSDSTGSDPRTHHALAYSILAKSDLRPSYHHSTTFDSIFKICVIFREISVTDCYRGGCGESSG